MPHMVIMEAKQDKRRWVADEVDSIMQLPPDGDRHSRLSGIAEVSDVLDSLNMPFDRQVDIINGMLAHFGFTMDDIMNFRNPSIH